MSYRSYSKDDDDSHIMQPLSQNNDVVSSSNMNQGVARRRDENRNNRVNVSYDVKYTHV